MSNLPKTESKVQGLSRQPKPKLAPVPRTRAEAARNVVLDVVLNFKAVALEIINDFRASNRFFQYKTGVIAAWTLLTVISLFIACPSYMHRPNNSLSARVRVQLVDVPGDHKIAAIFIENSGEKDWGDTLLKLNNTFTHALADLKAGGKAVLTVDKFTGSDGRPVPADLQLERLRIMCKRGDAEIDLIEAAR